MSSLSVANINPNIPKQITFKSDNNELNQVSRIERYKQSYNNLSTKEKVAVCTGILAGVVALGEAILFKGKHLRYLFKTKAISKPSIVDDTKLTQEIISGLGDKEKYLKALKHSELGSAPKIPDDLDMHIDFSVDSISKGSHRISIKSKDGKLSRVYISATDGKTVQSVIIYDTKTGKKSQIIKFNDGKLSNNEIFDKDGKVIKKASYYYGTERLRGVETRGSDGKTIEILYKDNGTDIERVFNKSADFGAIGSILA